MRQKLIARLKKLMSKPKYYKLSLLQLSKHLMFKNHAELFLEGDGIQW